MAILCLSRTADTVGIVQRLMNVANWSNPATPSPAEGVMYMSVVWFSAGTL